MNLNSFKYVVEIERCGSINRAARNLYISQSNLSSSLKSLEEELKYPIFSRTNRGIFPTPEGYLFLQSAKAILNEVEKIYNVPSLINPYNRISVSCTWSASLFRDFISFKNSNNPNSSDAYKETGLVQNFRDVRENKYNLSVFYCFHSRTSFHQMEAQKTELSCEVLKQKIPAVAIMSKQHPLAEKAKLRLDDIHSWPLAIFEGFEKEDYLDILNIPPNQQILYIFDRGGLVDLLSQRQFVTVVKRGSIDRLEENNLIEVPIPELRDTFDVLVLRHKSYIPNHREQLFIEYLKESIE